MHAHTKRWRCSSSTDMSNCTINIKLHLFQLIADNYNLIHSHNVPLDLKPLLPIPSLLRLLALTGERAGTEFASNSDSYSNLVIDVHYDNRNCIEL